jgi:hypothetical protein
MVKFLTAISFVTLVIITTLFYFQFGLEKYKTEVVRVSETAASSVIVDNPPKKNHAYHPYHAYEYPEMASYSYSNDSSAAEPEVGTGTPEATYRTPEILLKYVLFSIKYDSTMYAGETKSLILRMSPRNELRNLEKALKDKIIQQNQINDIEKVQSQYKYVSAELTTQNKCLDIQKKVPPEDRVYLPSINESHGDQIWQWDLTAPERPSTKYCSLTLYIHFCVNQNACLPMNQPDKEFNINIEIKLSQLIFSVLKDIGNTVSVVIIPIITVVGVIIGLFWRNKKRKNHA